MTPASSFQKCVLLDKWWLIKAEADSGGKRLAVAGLTSGCLQAKRVFTSLPILKRYDAYTLETEDGITVIIQGLIDKIRTQENGYPPEACNKFLIGFPLNWEVYFDMYFGKECLNGHQFGGSDCLNSNHGNDSSCGKDGTGLCSASISTDPFLQKDADWGKIIPSLMDACLLAEAPGKFEMSNGDHKIGNSSEKSNRSPKNSETTERRESRKIIMPKEPERMNNAFSEVEKADDFLKGNDKIKECENPSIGTSKRHTLRSAKRIISPFKLGKDVHVKTSDVHGKTIHLEEKDNYPNYSITSNADENRQKDAPGEILQWHRIFSFRKGEENDEKVPKMISESENAVIRSNSLAMGNAPEIVRPSLESLCDHNDFDSSKIDLNERVQDLLSSSVCCSDSEEKKDSSDCDMSTTKFHSGNFRQAVPSLMGFSLQKGSVTLDTSVATKAASTSKIRGSMLVKNQTSHMINNANAMNPLLRCDSQNDKLRCTLTAGSDPNASNFGSSDFQTERDYSGYENDEEPPVQFLTGMLSKDKMQSCAGASDLKLQSSNVDRHTDVSSEVKTGNRTITARSTRIDNGEQVNCVKNVSPEWREKLKTKEIDNRYLEDGQESNIKPVKSDIFTGNVTKDDKEMSNNDAENGTPAKEEVGTSELCKFVHRRSSSRIKHLKNKHVQGEKTNVHSQAELIMDLMSEKPTDIKRIKSGKNVSIPAEVTLGSRMQKSPTEEILIGHHASGLESGHFSFHDEAHDNVLHTSVKLLKGNSKATDSGHKNVMTPNTTEHRVSSMPVTLMKKSKKAKRSSLKSSSKMPFPFNSQFTRVRAKELSIAPLDSLNYKRSRSGRLLIPSLASWRNQKVVYDPDGNIAGITLGNDGKDWGYTVQKKLKY